MNKFVLLKQSFPVSSFERNCDGYIYIQDEIKGGNNVAETINPELLVPTIKAGEKYLYRVGKENGEFKDMCISLHNYKIIREYLFKNNN